jgi:hypothetical protein
MALTTNMNTAHQVRNHTVGQVVSDAGAAVDSSFGVGYIPRVVRFVNITDRVKLEWFEGMAPDSAIRTDATGASTLITTAGITANYALNGFSVKAAAIPASKTFTYETIG